MSLGDGFGVGFRRVVRFLMEYEGKGKGVGRVEGWGGDRQRNRQVNPGEMRQAKAMACKEITGSFPC